MILKATIRTKPEPHAKDRDGLETREISAEGDGYDAAYAGLEAQVPEGWGMLYVLG